MRQLLTLAILFSALSIGAQVNNIYTTAGISQTIGPPTFVPGARGSVVAIDTLNGLWWVNPNRLSGTTWFLMGHTLRQISGCVAPSGAPTKFQSWKVSNTCSPPVEYLWNGATWDCTNCGGSSTVSTDATLDGDGSGIDPLKIAQQGAITSQVLQWTGATWEPSWGNPYIYVTTGEAITTDVNEILIDVIGSDVTMGLPTCNAANDGKRFKFVRNGTDNFSVTIDPSGSQTFADGVLKKISYGKLAIDCTCNFSGGIGIWFFDNF